MLPAKKKNVAAALKRLDGLSKRLALMNDQEAKCPKMLEMALAMQGHLKYIQTEVLESHMRTYAEKKRRTKKEKEVFVSELIKAIGLSKR